MAVNKLADTGDVKVLIIFVVSVPQRDIEERKGYFRTLNERKQNGYVLDVVLTKH